LSILKKKKIGRKRPKSVSSLFSFFFCLFFLFCYVVFVFVFVFLLFFFFFYFFFYSFEYLTLKCITPHVIEPSFGIGRIIYCILEHAYVVREAEKRDNESREDEKRAFLALSPIIAPQRFFFFPHKMHPIITTFSLLKVSVLPLVQSPELLQFTAEIVKSLKVEGLQVLFLLPFFFSSSFSLPYSYHIFIRYV
jgi:hypothetical protein